MYNFVFKLCYELSRADASKAPLLHYYDDSITPLTHKLKQRDRKKSHKSKAFQVLTSIDI
jgi:hypothetical protein